MGHDNLRRALAASALALCATFSHAQGFDEGSFETAPGGGSSSATPAQTPSATGGFEEGSFDPGGTSVVAVPDPSGGGNVTGGDALPDLPKGGKVADDGGGGGGSTPSVDPAPNPTPNPTPPGPQVAPQITAFELRDFGVPPQQSLRQGQFHAPTPTAMPGGYLVTTELLVQAINEGVEMVIIDVLGSGYGLPSAYTAPALAAGGSFRDRTQQQAEAWLQQITGGVWDMPIVIYCSDPMCWLSYNASLRTIAAGYEQVYWYRGGVQAWEMVGLPLQPSGF